jgi:hypothetical protein
MSWGLSTDSGWPLNTSGGRTRKGGTDLLSRLQDAERFSYVEALALETMRLPGPIRVGKGIQNALLCLVYYRRG